MSQSVAHSLVLPKCAKRKCVGGYSFNTLHTVYTLKLLYCFFTRINRKNQLVSSELRPLSAAEEIWLLGGHFIHEKEVSVELLFVTLRNLLPGLNGCPHR